jgi:hypothetical protein
MTRLAELPFVTPEDIAERAAEAVHGGEMYRDFLRRFGAGNVDMTNVAYWAGVLAEGGIRRDALMVPYSHSTHLPEAAFDWPIYRAAILTEATRNEREARLARIAAVYPEAAAEARQAGVPVSVEVTPRGQRLIDLQLAEDERERRQALGLKPDILPGHTVASTHTGFVDGCPDCGADR